MMSKVNRKHAAMTVCHLTVVKASFYSENSRCYNDLNFKQAKENKKKKKQKEEQKIKSRKTREAQKQKKSKNKN